jgi:hypothetical protein
VNIEAKAKPHLATRSQIIGKVLSPAIRLWLRSQADSIAALEFHIEGHDRQILQGSIPQVTVRAEQVVYQGLHLNRLRLTATHIQINLGQVLKGKPLRLLTVVPVQGEVTLTQADLEASLTAPLLQQALVEVLQHVLQQVNSAEFPDLATLRTQPIKLHHPHVKLQTNRLQLKTEAVAGAASRWQITLQTVLQLPDPSCLQLAQLELHYATAGQPPTVVHLPPLDINLGSDVKLQQLRIEPEEITCHGKINVIPAE